MISPEHAKAPCAASESTRIVQSPNSLIHSIAFDTDL